MQTASKEQPRTEASPAADQRLDRQYAPPLAKTGSSLFTVSQLEKGVSQARDYLLSLQYTEGYWIFDLEADCTIPAEYLLLQFHLGRPMPERLQEGIARYLRRRQLMDGGWPLFEGDSGNISASVKAYFALKLAGDSPELPHMAEARKYILSQGGAAAVNVFTRITLALFGQLPWRTLPAMPVEIMLLPSWFFFHLHKVSYWSRTVIVPLLILYAQRPVRRLPPEKGISELFVKPPEKLRHMDRFSPGRFRKNGFLLLDRILKQLSPFPSGVLRRKALRKAEKWTRERMAGSGGMGAIFPAMVNAVKALKALGYPDDHPDVRRGLKALDELLVWRGDECFCQPCNSPVWDTALSLSVLLEAGIEPEHEAVKTATSWLWSQQHNGKGDWAVRHPQLEPAGWAFQFENGFYPDVDDSAMVLMALLRAGHDPANGPFRKAVEWLLAMQSSDGGWGAFDIDNNYLYLNDIPFADHGALLDPSTADLTARCLELLAMLGHRDNVPCVAKALAFLRREQEKSGAWYGRWGVNYLYGTWAALSALHQSGEDMSQPYIQKAVAWLKSCQNQDYGWGESCCSYNDPLLAGKGNSTPSQTSWALLALMAAGEVNSMAVQRGIHYLLSKQNAAGSWDEKEFTGTGFPRVFYLRYHGYSQYFPLWALAVYRRLRTGKMCRPDEAKSSGRKDQRFP